MIKNSSYYVVEKRFNHETFTHEYGGSFYDVNGVFIKHVTMSTDDRTYTKTPEMDMMLDPKFIFMARPAFIVFGNHLKGGLCVTVLDKNQNVIDTKQYCGPLNTTSFINYQLFESKNPIQVDYRWLMGGDIKVVDTTKARQKKNNGNIIDSIANNCSIQ